MKNTVKIFACFLLLLCSTFAFAQKNPIEGKTYCLDILGNDALTFEFKTGGVVNLKAINEFGKTEESSGTYTFNSDSTVTISIDGEPLIFNYDKSNDTLIANLEDQGVVLLLTPKDKTSSTVKNKSSKANNPPHLVGRLYIGTFMGMDFFKISFTDEKNCVLQALTDPSSATYETEAATYIYDKTLGTVIITDSTNTKVVFEYDSSDDSLSTDIGQGIIIKCTRKK